MAAPNIITIPRTVSLDGLIPPEALAGTLYGGEALAHKFVVGATQDGAAVALTGTVTAHFLRKADDAEVYLQGEIVDGAASVTLAQSCYTQPGRFELTVFVTANGTNMAVYSCSGNVRNTSAGTIIDPGTVIPSVDDIIAKFDEMDAAVDAADAATSAATSAAEAANAAAEAASTAGDSKFVRYDAAQTLTTAQQAQARANAAAAGEIEHLLTADVIPDTVQAITFDTEGNVSAITHTRAGAAVRTDAFAFAEASITETRTLSTGQRLTLVTDLDTLATTATYAAA